MSLLFSFIFPIWLEIVLSFFYLFLWLIVYRLFIYSLYLILVSLFSFIFYLFYFSFSMDSFLSIFFTDFSYILWKGFEWLLLNWELDILRLLALDGVISVILYLFELFVFAYYYFELIYLDATIFLFYFILSWLYYFTPLMQEFEIFLLSFFLLPSSWSAEFEKFGNFYSVSILIEIYFVDGVSKHPWLMIYTTFKYLVILFFICASKLLSLRAYWTISASAQLMSKMEGKFIEVYIYIWVKLHWAVTKLCQSQLQNFKY